MILKIVYKGGKKSEEEELKYNSIKYERQDLCVMGTFFYFFVQRQKEQKGKISCCDFFYIFDSVFRVFAIEYNFCTREKFVMKLWPCLFCLICYGSFKSLHIKINFSVRFSLDFYRYQIRKNFFCIGKI